MEQYGRVLAAMRPEFVAADSIAAIREVLKKGQVPVWMPYEMVVADPLIPENWNVTSDSLECVARRQTECHDAVTGEVVRNR